MNTCIYLFFIGGYLQKYQPSITSKQLTCAFTGMLFIMFAYTIYKNYRLHSNDFLIYAMHYHGLVLPFSVIVFLMFRQLHIPPKCHSVINAIAPLSFAVYIIHPQPNIDDKLWEYVTNSVIGMNHWLILPHCIITCVLIFVLCIIIEKIRILFNNRIKLLWGKCFG